jgi:hypothetical protein
MISGEPTVTFGPCCFCAQEIADTATDPCSITVTTRKGLWQVWKCHGECFRARLTNPPDEPDFFEPAHF